MTLVGSTKAADREAVGADPPFAQKGSVLGRWRQSHRQLPTGKNPRWESRQTALPSDESRQVAFDMR